MALTVIDRDAAQKQHCAVEKAEVNQTLFSRIGVPYNMFLEMEDFVNIVSCGKQTSSPAKLLCIYYRNVM